MDACGPGAGTMYLVLVPAAWYLVPVWYHALFFNSVLFNMFLFKYVNTLTLHKAKQLLHYPLLLALGNLAESFTEQYTMVIHPKIHNSSTHQH